MKKFLWGKVFAAAAVLASGLFVVSGVQPALADESLDLRPRLAVGQSVSLVNKTVTTIDMMGQNQKIEMSLFMTATGREGGGLSIVYDRVKADFASPMMGSFSFDSDAKEAPDNPIADAIGKSFTSFVGTPIEVEFDADGKVQVKNAAEIDEKIKSALAATPMAGQIDTSSYKQGLDYFAPMLPKSTVKKGDSWTSIREQNMQGMTLALTSENTLEEVSGDSYTIASTGTLKLNAPEAAAKDDPQAQMLAMMLKNANAETIEIAGSGTYSRRDGLAIASTSTASFKINMSIPGQGEMAMVVSTKGTVERIK